MTEERSRLEEIADELKQGKQPEAETVRTLLGWFDAQHRGYHVNSLIERALGRYGIKTLPDFRYAYIVSKINFIPATQDDATASGETKSPPTETGDDTEIPVEAPELIVLCA